MGLVWTLVGAEPCVAVDAVGAVFDIESGYVGVVLSYSPNELPAPLVPPRLYLAIPLFVGRKPFPVIVARKLAQKADCFFHYFIVFVGPTFPDVQPGRVPHPGHAPPNLQGGGQAKGWRP